MCIVYFNNCQCRDYFYHYGQQDAFYDLNTTYHEKQLRTGALQRAQECIVATPTTPGGQLIEFGHFEFSHEQVMQDKTGEDARVFFGKPKGKPIRLAKSVAAKDPRYRRFFNSQGYFKRRSVC